MTAREVLVKSLRDMDSETLGFSPKSALVIFTGESGELSYINGGASNVEIIGSLFAVANNIMK